MNPPTSSTSQSSGESETFARYTAGLPATVTPILSEVCGHFQVTPAEVCSRHIDFESVRAARSTITYLLRCGNIPVWKIAKRSGITTRAIHSRVAAVQKRRHSDPGFAVMLGRWTTLMLKQQN